MRPVLIAGPTASGKSALALAIAERDGGLVINADASQVYACWRVLTARPSDDDLARAPHRLYGHVAADVRHSAGDWLRDVGGALAEAHERGLRPIVVGGTGLYFHALTHGLAPIPAVPPELRAVSQARIDAGGLDGLIAELDAETAARIDRRNPMRVQRAWEVLQATGRGLARWHDDPAAPPLLSRDSVEAFVIWPDLSGLNAAIARRFDAMLAGGALDEARRFAGLGVDPRLPAARVLGAAELAGCLAGETDPATAAEAAVVATRQFAKRQRTWFRNRMADWPRLDPAGDMVGAVPAR